MIKIHDRENRGKTNMGWLDSRHTFSFGHFNDPSRMGFRSLRVINDDRVIPGAGFDTHRHHDMEIITYVLSGALAHKDSLGNGSVIQAGDIQRMTAGSGIAHSEFNASDANPVHFLQIWIIPEERGLTPSYQQEKLDFPEGKLGIIGDRSGTGAITVHQDVTLLGGRFHDGAEADYAFDGGRAGFLHVAKGQIELNDETLKEGDGAEISGESLIHLKAMAESEILLFDLA